MAKRCTGDRCHYGYGHRAEHEDAARKGWRTRRYGEAKYLAKAFHGYEVHTHQRGKVILRDQEDDSTFELSAREADEVIRQVKADERSQYTQARLTDKATRERVKADRLAAQHRDREADRARREAARADRDLERERQAQAKLAAHVENELFRNAISEVVGYGGIRNYRRDANGQRILQEDVWSQIPKYYRARADDRNAKTADEVAAELAESFPYLGINSDSDLAQAFATRRFKQRERKSASKIAA